MESSQNRGNDADQVAKKTQSIFGAMKGWVSKKIKDIDGDGGGAGPAAPKTSVPSGIADI